jgi:uncharacterized protein (TIGR02147 family)
MLRRVHFHPWVVQTKRMQKFNELIKLERSLLMRLISCETYQAFLNLYFSECKERFPSFSYALFAGKAKISKSLVKGILDGKKRITLNTAPSICNALNLPTHLDVFFLHLIALEEPKVLAHQITEEKIRGLLKKFANLALEEYQENALQEDSFQHYDVPYIYAALGSFEEGATFEEVISRTQLPPDSTLKQLKFMIQQGIVTQDKDRYFATRQFSFLQNLKANSYFHNFYLSALEKHQFKARHQFDNNKLLFYTNILSIKEKDLPILKKEISDLINSFVRKNEVPNGDKVIMIQLGMI